MPIHDFNLFTHFAPQFAAHTSKHLIFGGDGPLYTYADIDKRSAQFANYLTKLGVQHGDRVSVQVGKSPQSLCLYLACLRGGFVYHPLNTGYKQSELEYFLQDAKPAVVVCDPAAASMVTTTGVNHVLTMDAEGYGSLADNANSEHNEFATVPRQESDLAALLYSSGTTGVPKGIMLTHYNLLSNTEALVQAWEFSSDDKLMHALPIFHVHGLFVAIGCVLLSGASMHWLNAFNARTVGVGLRDCTVMMGVPTYYTRLLAEKDFGKAQCQHMRLFISGSAPLLEETFAAFEHRTGHRILERYGMTETNMNTSNPLHGARKPGTVGPPLPGVEVRITDDNGATLAEGEIGNLQVRGPNVFAGYWNMPDKTNEDFTEDGFFNTGDKGKIDDYGYVSIVGRAKDVVITGGLNVYPKEVELFLDDLPGIHESAVIGVSHPDFGEAVVAVVVPQDDCQPQPTEIIQAVRQSLADFKTPKQVLLVPELPRNTMGKVQKNLLREKFSNLFEKLN